MLFRLAFFLPFAIFAACLLGLAALIFFPHKILGVGEETLGYSVQQEIGFTGGESSCKERRREFACVVTDPSSSTDPQYLIRVKDDCWRARRPGQPAARAKLRGCIGLDDYIRLPSL